MNPRSKRRARVGALLSLALVSCGDDSGGSDGLFGDGSGSHDDGAGPGSSSDDGGSPGDGASGSNGGGSSSDDGDAGSGGSSGTTTDAGGSATSSTSGGVGTTTSTGTPTPTGPVCTTGDTSSDTADCEAPYEHVVCDDDDDPFHALGLGCMGDATNSIPIANESFNAIDPLSWAVASQYGTHMDAGGDPTWGPTEGNKFLFITTGQIAAPDMNGVIQMLPGEAQSGIGMDNNNVDMNGTLPAPIDPSMGSNGGGGGDPFICCDGVGDCSDTLFDQWTIGLGSVFDLLSFQFDLDVPVGTHGYEFDFVWFSTEFPEYVAPEPFNDIFLVWSTSETYTGNVTFINNQPLTVTALQDEVRNSGLFGTAPELENTGYDGLDGFSCFPQDPFNDPDCPTGGATGWFVAKGSAAPEETFQLTFTIFDMGDPILDTAAIIDNFRWDCEGCNPAEEQCGVGPQ